MFKRNRQRLLSDDRSPAGLILANIASDTYSLRYENYLFLFCAVPQTVPPLSSHCFSSPFLSFLQWLPFFLLLLLFLRFHHYPFSFPSSINSSFSFLFVHSLSRYPIVLLPLFAFNDFHFTLFSLPPFLHTFSQLS